MAILLAGATLLAACEQPAPLPAPTSTPVPRPEITRQSPASLEVQAYYQRVQNSLLTQGLLRKGGGGPGEMFSASALARNFLKIAFYKEYTTQSGRLVAHETPSVLSRWDQPVRYSISFGASVPPEKRSHDQNQISRFTNRLSQLTGLSFANSPTATNLAANLHIFIVNEDERPLLGPSLHAINPRISTASINAALNMARSTYCVVFSADPGESGIYDHTFVIIRGEHPDLLRTSCIHEEIAQSLGLSNDSPQARPSIFNDDNEFALLTYHDELLLRILYDKRLRPGISKAEARPIVEAIAAELVAGSV